MHYGCGRKRESRGSEEGVMGDRSVGRGRKWGLWGVGSVGHGGRNHGSWGSEAWIVGRDRNRMSWGSEAWVVR